jgi:hypothetical protein
VGETVDEQCTLCNYLEKLDHPTFSGISNSAGLNLMTAFFLASPDCVEVAAKSDGGDGESGKVTVTCRLSDHQ